MFRTTAYIFFTLCLYGCATQSQQSLSANEKVIKLEIDTRVKNKSEYIMAKAEEACAPENYLIKTARAIPAQHISTASNESFFSSSHSTQSAVYSDWVRVELYCNPTPEQIELVNTMYAEKSADKN